MLCYLLFYKQSLFFDHELEILHNLIWGHFLRDIKETRFSTLTTGGEPIIGKTLANTIVNDRLLFHNRPIICLSPSEWSALLLLFFKFSLVSCPISSTRGNMSATRAILRARVAFAWRDFWNTMSRVKCPAWNRNMDFYTQIFVHFFSCFLQ